MAAISNSNRFNPFRRLERCRTSHVEPQLKRKLHRIPLIPRVQLEGTHFKIGIQSHPNLRQKFSIKGLGESQLSPNTIIITLQIWLMRMSTSLNRFYQRKCLCVPVSSHLTQATLSFSIVTPQTGA